MAWSRKLTVGRPNISYNYPTTQAVDYRLAIMSTFCVHFTNPYTYTEGKARDRDNVIHYGCLFVSKYLLVCVGTNAITVVHLAHRRNCTSRRDGHTTLADNRFHTLVKYTGVLTDLENV